MNRSYVFIIGLLLILLLILWIGPINLYNTVKDVNKIYLVAAIITYLLAVFVKSVRWGFIINQPLNLKTNFIVRTIGLLGSNLTPMRTGGIVITAIAGRKLNQIDLHEGLSAGLTERFADLIIVGILLVLAAVFVEKFRFISIAGAGLILITLTVIYFLNWREGSSIWIYEKIHFILVKLPIKEDTLDRIYNKIINGLKGMVSYTQSYSNTKNMSIILVLTTVSWLLECSRLLLVFYAFNVDIGVVNVVIILLLANIAGIVTALPGGIGAVEISLTGLSLLFGIPGAISGGIAIVDRFISFWLINLLGIIFALFYAKDILGDIKSYISDIQTPKS
ncbi:MAG: flippase-like domain-containing protein [Methanobacterium sp.]|uniref:flippase-like domain-containing protein n=1 Tax=Methanobacterium sp. TaxID=2164 RepID=UPI003D651AE6|nr:flippase-like domain-containing protein [Methanobacterium sp.]